MSHEVKMSRRVSRVGLKPYLEAGWQLIPLRGKRPRHRNWLKWPYDSAKVVNICVARNWNVGVRLSRQQLVIDVDPRNGGAQGFKNLCADLDLDHTSWPRVETGSGGSHFYMTLPEGVRVVDTLKDYAGVEFKSFGRQVVAAGSIHPDTGHPYFWEGIDHPSDALQAPACLVDAIRRPQRKGEAVAPGRYSQEQIARALDALDVTEFRDQDKWFRLMAAVHHASNGEARSEFIDWSTSDPQYAGDAEIIGRRWDSLHANRSNGITARTLDRILSEAGVANLQAAGDASGDFDDEVDWSDDSWMEGGDLSEATTTQNGTGLSYRIAQDIEPEAIEWCWPNRFAVGKLGMIAGFPDQGKSQITMNIAATVSKGGDWPDGEGQAEQGRC